MAGTAHAAAAIAQLTRVRARIGHQLGHAGDAEPARGVGIHQQHIGHARQQRDRREVAQGVVELARADPGIDRMGDHRAQQQGGAVGCSLGGQLAAQAAAQAGAVVHQHGAQPVLHAFGQGPGQRIHHTTGGEGHDQARGPGQPMRCLLSPGRAGGQQRGGTAQHQQAAYRAHQAQGRAGLLLVVHRPPSLSALGPLESRDQAGLTSLARAQASATRPGAWPAVLTRSSSSVTRSAMRLTSTITDCSSPSPRYSRATLTMPPAFTR
eukprot:Opistho-2@74066